MAEQKPQAKSELLEAIRFNRAQKALDVVFDGQIMRVSDNGCDALALVLALAKGSASWEKVAMAIRTKQSVARPRRLRGVVP